MIEVELSPAEIPAREAADLNVCLTNTGPGSCQNVIFTIRLPPGLTRLSGRERIEESRLDPGQRRMVTLRVRADNTGEYRLTSPNFSYRDHRGLPHRETGFAAGLTVTPARELPPPPRVTTELRTKELVLGDWSSLRSRIINHGAADVFDLEIASRQGFRLLCQAGSRPALGHLHRILGLGRRGIPEICA